MILKISKRLWDSPTCTSWGSQVVQALRLLAVTPLILVSFDETEIAVWYLFTSLTFFGSIVSSRVGLTFSRMISFAMGGSVDLSPIKERPKERENAEPNWTVVERAYATTGALNALITLVITFSALGLGWYGLSELLAEYGGADYVWYSFFVMVLSQSAVFFYQKYTAALRGMNYVALSNRWGVVFSLLSIVVGIVVLKCGGGLLSVTLAMQLIVLLSIPQNGWLLRAVEEGRFKKFSGFCLDREMLGWAWEPAWKGFIVSMANSGSLQLASVFCARFLSVTEVASILLTLRLLNSFKSISEAPYLSQMPFISRMFAEGKLEILKGVVLKRMFLCQMLFACSILSLVVVGQPMLTLIGANASLLPDFTLLSLGFCMLIQNFIKMATVISASGNHIVCVWRGLWSFVFSVICSYYLIPVLGFWGLLVGLFLPYFIIINIKPVRISADKLEVPVRLFFGLVTVFPVVFFVFFVFIFYLI